MTRKIAWTRKSVDHKIYIKKPTNVALLVYIYQWIISCKKYDEASYFDFKPILAEIFEAKFQEGYFINYLDFKTDLYYYDISMDQTVHILDI